MNSRPWPTTGLQAAALASYAPHLILLGSAALLGGALLFQYVGGLAPCKLCIYQRWPHGIAIALALSLAVFAPGPTLVRLGLAALALVLLVGAGIGAYHVGIEQGWIAGPSSCSGVAGLDATNIDQLRDALLKAPVVRCDEVAWSLFGISMAGYNVLASLALAGLAIWAALRLGRGTA